jgi:hypothetical protein
MGGGESRVYFSLSVATNIVGYQKEMENAGIPLLFSRRGQGWFLLEQKKSDFLSSPK